MKNVQISFDDKLLEEVDLIVAKRRSSRSAVVFALQLEETDHD